MMDVGEQDRPPADPPDRRKSWVNMVTGSNNDGIPIPEEVVDDKFVTDRLCLEFPYGEDGEPVIISNEVLEAMNGLWKKCMIVKVLGRNVSVSALNRRLRDLWKPMGEMQIMDLPRKFFMIRFAAEEEYINALTGGPWRIFGSYLLTQAWTPEFDPLRDEISTTPVWVRLSNLPVNFYHRSILIGIARGLGHPLKVDLTTLNFERARFARVCVEVNLRKPLKGLVMVNGERYYVFYEGLNTICSKCGMYGHLVHTCPQANQEQVTTNQMMTPSVRSHTRLDDGFSVVRRSGKKQIKIGINEGSSSAKPGVGRKSQQTDIPVQKVFEKIKASNMFSHLEDTTFCPENTEKDISKEEAKSTNTSQDNLTRHMSVGHQVVDNLGDHSKSSENGFDGVFREQRPETSKQIDKLGIKRIGPKPRHKPNKPLRGLIFGPIEESTKLTESGKRLRVEKESIGHRGGVFGIDMADHEVLEPGEPSHLDDLLNNNLEDTSETNRGDEAPEIPMDTPEVAAACCNA